MTLQRTKIDLGSYRGRKIEGSPYGPDWICYIDGIEQPNFFLSKDACFKAGCREVERQEKAS